MNLDYQKQCLENYFEGVKVPNGTFIAGGAVLSILTGQPVNDLDLYFSSKESVAEFIEENYNVYLHSVTEKSISLSMIGLEQKFGTKEFQLIYFDYYNSAEEIFEDFDYSCCMCAYSFDTKEFYFHPDFWKDVAAKKLRFNPNTAFPIISLLRIDKYKNKGFSINNSELRKIALSISKLNLEDKRIFMNAYGSMYGNESLVDLLIEDDSKFNPEVALERFVTEYQEPTLIFNTQNNIRKFIDKPTPYKVEWMVDYLLQKDSYLRFKEQPFYIKIEGIGCDKKYNIFGVENKRVVSNPEISYSQDVLGSYAQAHILLYKDMYDPLIESLNNMIVKGQGFANNQNDPDLIQF